MSKLKLEYFLKQKKIMVASGIELIVWQVILVGSVTNSI